MRASDFVDSYIDAWNHRDPHAVASHLANNGIYRDVPENARRNRDELIIDLTRFFARYEHQYELIGDITSSANTIAFEYRMYLPDGGAGATTIRGAEFIKLQGEAAMIITDYYDTPNDNGPSRIVDLSVGDAKPAKYRKSGLGDEQMLRYKERLNDLMRSEKAYLRSDLTLPKLATAIDCSVNHLSQVINAGFGMSFFDYLNSFRIEHAKTLLSHTDEQCNAILNVAFAVGFNSNSAFYAAFKKSVGQTPAQFRRTVLARRTRSG